MARIDQIQRRVLSDSEKVVELWRCMFGEKIHFTWDETSPKYFHTDEKIISKAVTQLIDDINQHLNKNAEPNRVGDLSFFMREPHNDRLILMYSTSSALQDPDGADNRIANWGENYDPTRKTLFYSLCDRLATRRNDEESRKQRGLTGWIAVSGHYLLINGEQDSNSLDLISKIRPETAPECNTYGPPFWGRRMSEAPSIPDRPKRYLGVPIKSVDSPNATIGVIRYACPLEGASLTVNDLAFLEEISFILSALLHLESTKVKALRAAEFPHQVEKLRKNGNLNNFLSFMSVGLRSQIVSVYLDVGRILDKKTASCVRLVDAVGIDGSVSIDREKLRDYHGDEKPSGFTWSLFNQRQTKPVIRTSVVRDKSWGGFNTEIFYRAALSSLGIQEDQQGIRRAVERYRIKIMGMPINSHTNETIGVIKAEFPTSFDDADHYDDDDKLFFSECAHVVGEYLENILKVLSGRFFTENISEYNTFLRGLTEVLRTNLILKDEAKGFWSKLEKFLIDNKTQLKMDGLQAFRDVPGPLRKELVSALLEIVRKLPGTLTNVLEALLKAILIGQ